MMSLHKLTTGWGYDYLTRQVAAMDSTEKDHTTLATYYDQKGETPGHWLGSGLVGIDGLKAGDVVTADQMLSLFGLGDHPLTTQRLAALDDTATERDIRDAMKFGNRYGIYPGVSEFRSELAERLARLEPRPRPQGGRPGGAGACRRDSHPGGTRAFPCPFRT